jgi:hypothetical protein
MCCSQLVSHAQEESYQLARCTLQEMLSTSMAMSKVHDILDERRKIQTEIETGMLKKSGVSPKSHDRKFWE